MKVLINIVNGKLEIRRKNNVNGIKNDYDIFEKNKLSIDLLYKNEF